MKTVANLFAQTYARLGSDSQKDRDFITLERLAPDEDGYCSFVKRVESVAPHEYWIAREKNILMLLKRTPHVVRLRKEEKNNTSYQIIKTKDAGISLAHWLRTKPRLANSNETIKHPFIHVHAFLQLAKGALTALKEIHEAGVVHSQLRPDNLCIAYSPYPYQFDTALSINYSNVTLIDFMFSMSSTLKLSRHLPVTITAAPSTQSALLKNALKEDQQTRQADVIQRIDYSVDFYALGFILQQIFQQNLMYPEGLEPQLSMGIHQLISQLLSFDEGIPAPIKLRYLHLLPHNDYLQEITQLLHVAQQNQDTTTISLLFDPAQFLEIDSVFHLDSPVVDLEALATIESNAKAAQESSVTPVPAHTTLTKPIEKTTMTDTSLHSAQANNHIEISKIIVIVFIVSLQVLYVLYTEGQKLGLDIVASMGLVATIGIALALAVKLFAPPKPLPKLSPLVLEPQNNNLNNNNLVPATEGAAPMTNSDESNKNNTTTHDIPELTDATPHTDAQDTTTPSVVLLKSATSTQATKQSPPIEVNKWLVIAIIIGLQLSYIWYTTDFGSTKAKDPISSAPVVNSEPTVEDIIPEDPLVSEAAPTDDMMPTETSNNEAAIANIELLSEASSVKAPEIASPKTKKVKTTDNIDSVLLSGSPVSDTQAKKAKVVAKKEVQGQTAIPLTKEQAQATEKTPPVAIDLEQAAAVSANNVKEKAEAAANESKAQSEKPSPKSLTRGLAEAQNVMGWSYYHGNNVKKDYEEAFKWFQKAANLGEASAQFNVGMMYAAGTGVKQDLTEAAKWYKKSAEQGKSSAQLNLGMMYISGRGIRQNIDEGKKWLGKAAEQGDVTAKANLSWLTQQGYIKENAAANEEAKAAE